MNVDPQEIAKFEALAARWWDRNSEFKPLHDINPLRANYIDEHSPVSGRRLADVGCGGGILAESMALRGATVTGIDMGEAPLQVARLHLLETGLDVNYERIPVERLAAERPHSFDLITCMEMLEHVPDPASVVRACAKLLKPGGRAFFSTINRNPKSYLFAIIGAEYVLGLLPKGTHDFARFIRPSELDAWLRTARLELEHLIGLVYNPLTRVYKLAPDVDVNYLLCCRKLEDD
jgi:2-polyprenyl-6-hydroxyphenyl methylase/3-demethylubiquinone-9 3-methyltransferase